MVDALREAHRVLGPSGVLIDVRPLVEPIEVGVMLGAQPVWTKTVEAYSAPDDIAAADNAVQHAVSHEWIAFGTSLPFTFDIYCDNAAELRTYVEGRKLCGAEIPYAELDERAGHPARLRCRRPWMLSTYRKK
jgi:hypothetical protein